VEIARLGSSVAGTVNSRLGIPSEKAIENGVDRFLDSTACVARESRRQVHVTMRNGRRAEFTVQTVDTVAIIARDGTRYDQTDILTVERREFNGVKTTFLLTGILGGVLLFAIGAMMASLAGGI
jgi:hypothetical protein